MLWFRIYLSVYFTLNIFVASIGLVKSETVNDRINNLVSLCVGVFSIFGVWLFL